MYFGGSTHYTSLVQPGLASICPFCNSFGSKRMCLFEISIALITPVALLDLESSFIQNGGDSLSAMQLQAAFAKNGAKISLGPIFSATTLLQLAEYLTAKATQACEDVSPPGHSFVGRPRALSTQETPSKRMRRSIKDGVGTGVLRYPMTEIQFSLVQSTLKNPGRNVISYFEIHRPEALPALRRAWRTVLNLEPIFRMAFEIDESGAYMYERDEVLFEWNETFVKDSAAYKEAVERPALDTSIKTWFDVITFVPSKGEERSTVIWRVHHAFIDGLSASLVRNKVRQVLSGERIEPGPSFTTFVFKLRALQQQTQDSTIAFWKRQRNNHASSATRVLFPSPSTNNEPRTSTIGQVYAEYDLKKISVHCKLAGVTVASLYYAAWGLALSKYADTSQVCFGVVLSGRALPIEGVEYVIGPTINTLPLHISFDACTTVQNYVRTVFTSLLELSAVQCSTPAHGFTRNFTTAVNVRPAPPLASSPDGSTEHPHTRVLSDIPIQVEIGNGLIRLCYDPEKFLEPHMRRLSTTFARALDLIMDRNLTLGPFLNGVVEKQDLASIGNWTSKSTTLDSAGDDLVSLFVRVAQMNPSAIAVQHHSYFLTYDELHRQSSISARYVSNYIGPGDIVCVHADGTINWIIAIYAVLKAGATYCPFDPDLPSAVRNINFETAGAKLFLTGSVAAKSTKPPSAKHCFSIEEFLQEGEIDLDPMQRAPRPDSTAYLCFTSGSTGKPKGVLCYHRGLVAFQKDFQVRLCARLGWKIAQFMSPAFDGSIHEIFSALSYGATLVLKDASSPFAHLKAADAAILTPSVAAALDVHEFPDLKVIYLVGEVVPQGVCNAWADKKRLFNMYGPTEATCGATIKELAPREPVTLGTPNPSTRVYILDTQRRLVPWGVVGEICLAGVQVAAGYIGRPDETATKFLLDTINPQYEGERMYKTGDRAYWTESGELAYVGREDRQVKLRGFRIDLDDLEARMIRADENCTSAAVVVQDGRLVALAQPANLDLTLFKSRLGQHIPGYALPRRVHAVSSFPTTRIGKLDYKAIATMAFMDDDRGYQATPSEERVVLAVRDILGTSVDTKIDLDSTFSDLGMDSILHISLSHSLSRFFNRRIPFQVLLSSTTIRHLAHTLDVRTDPSSRPEENILGTQHVSPIEKDWWWKYDQNPHTSSFNVTYASRLFESVDRTRLASAWNSVLRRHRILSCRYTYSDSSEIKREYAERPPVIKQVAHLDILSEANIPFDLAKDDLIRVFISPTRMLVVISHIICDLTTLKELLQEVSELYNGNSLAPVAKTYFQTSWTMPAIPSHLSFWSHWLSYSAPTHFSVGNNFQRKTWAGSSHLCAVPNETYQDMLRFGVAHKVTMHQLALAAVTLALQHHEDACDITLGAPFMNRNSEEDLSAIGLFLEPLPIRIEYPCTRQDLDGSVNIHCGLQKDSMSDHFIQAVKRNSRAALSHAVPWDQLLSHLDVKSDIPNHPIFDVMVTFHEADHEIRFPIEGVEFIPTWTVGAKFKLMAEFTARDKGGLVLRLEYSIECFTEIEVELLGVLILEALSGLTSGDDFMAVLHKLRYLKAQYVR